MGRYHEAVCRLCRREGMKLYLKGEKCYTDKCPVAKDTTPPGMHPPSRRKPSDSRCASGRSSGCAGSTASTRGSSSGTSRWRLGPRGSPARGCCSSWRPGSTTSCTGSGWPRAARRRASSWRTATSPWTAGSCRCPRRWCARGRRSPSPRAAGAWRTSRRSWGTRRGAAAGVAGVHPDTLSGRMLTLPAREDIDVPVHEQLIIEYYSR